MITDLVPYAPAPLDPGLQFALQSLALAAIGVLGLLIRYVGIRLQGSINEAVRAAQAAEASGNGRYTALEHKLIDAQLRIDELNAIISRNDQQIQKLLVALPEAQAILDQFIERA